MVLASSYLQPPLPRQSSELWATLTKQEERVVELNQEEGADDAIDEVAVDESEVSHGIHPLLPVRILIILSHHLQTLEGMVMDPPPKILSGFKLDDIHPWSQVGVAGWSMHKLNSCNDSGHCSFSFLIIYSGVLYYYFLFLLAIRFYFLGSAY